MAAPEPASSTRRSPVSPGTGPPAAGAARRPERLKGLVVATFALAFSALLLSSVPGVIRDHFEIGRDPVRVTGVVDHVEADSAYGWRPYVAYQDHEGRTHRLRLWAWYDWLCVPEAGDTFPVVYARHAPDIGRVDTFWGEFGGSVRFGCIGVFCGLGGLVVLWRVVFRGEPLDH